MERWMKKKFREVEIDAILLMVKESAERLKAHDADFFEEYEETVRETKTVRPSDPKADEFTSPFLATDVLLGVGLALLGQTAAALFEWICHRALDRGSGTVLDWLKSQQKPAEIVEEASKAICVVLPLPKGVDEEHLRLILAPQLEALLNNPELTSKIGPR
jgi:hypothetical protein